MLPLRNPRTSTKTPHYLLDHSSPSYFVCFNLFPRDFPQITCTNQYFCYFWLNTLRSHLNRSESGEVSTGSGKLRSKRSPKDAGEGRSKKDGGDEEGGGKKKKGARKSKEPVASAEVPVAPSAANEEASAAAFHAPSASAFGIDAIMGDDSSSEEDGVSRHSSTWGKKFEIKHRAEGFETNEADDESIRRASSFFTLQGNPSKLTPLQPTAATTTSLAPTTTSTTSPGDEDFFADLDRTRSGHHLSIPNADRERKLSQIPPSAQVEFENAMKKLNGGHLVEANAAIAAALSQLNELAFKNNVAVATQWCTYAQLIGLLVEMQRLNSEKLYAQRALLARFVGLLGLRLENQDHALICLRMAINRNMELENFRTAGQLLQSFASMPALSELDRQNLPKKLDICAAHNYSEAHVPTGSSLDPVSGQFLLNGYSYALCHKTMLLIRDPTHHVCRYCDATFSEQASQDHKCYFCDSTLETQS